MGRVVFLAGNRIEFKWGDGKMILLTLEDSIETLARGGGRTELLVWAQIVETREQTEAIREQTEAIREFTQLAKTQAKRADELMESRSPESILELVTKGFPEVAKALQDAGIGSQSTGTRTIVPGANGG